MGSTRSNHRTLLFFRVGILLLFLLPLAPFAGQQPLSLSPQTQNRVAAPAAAQRGNGAASEGGEEQKAIVDYLGDLMTKRSANDSTIYLIGNVAFHHNGTFIQCDSAHRYDDYRMEGFGNVIINKDSTFIYGDRVSYDGHTDIAKVYSPLLKLINGDATMWVYNYMEFNTKTNVGRYTEGGVIVQRDNMMESDHGLYNGDNSTIKFMGRVAMRNDNYKMRTDSIGYNLNNEVVTFLTKTYIWDKERDFLTADAGDYVRSSETYHFTKNAYAMTADQEFWADTMTYESAIRKVFMNRNIQILDTAQRSIGLGDFGFYSDSLKQGMLTQRPAVISYDEVQQDTITSPSVVPVLVPVDDSMALTERTDTITTLAANSSVVPVDDSMGMLMPDSVGMQASRVVPFISDTLPKQGPLVPDSAFMRADTIYFDSYPLGKSKPKPVQEPNTPTLMPAGDSTSGAAGDIHKGLLPLTDSAALVSDSLSVADSTRVALVSDSLSMTDSTRVTLVSDSLVVDSTRVAVRDGALTAIGVEEPPLPVAPEPITADSVTLMPDSVMQRQPLPAMDSTASGPKKDTLERVIRAFYDVKMFRTDMQGVCDSLIAFSVDSTASLFGRPIIWNGDNQLTADRIDIYSSDEQLDYAVFNGDPFITQKVEGADTLFNQAQSRYMEAWFRDNEIYQAMLEGNVLNNYYMSEKGLPPDKFFTISCAKLTIDFEDREPVLMNWGGRGDWSIFSLTEIPADQSQRLSGFSWQPELKPKNRYEITDRSVRPSRRYTVNGYELPSFLIEIKLFEFRNQLLKSGGWRDRSEPMRVDINDFRNSNLLF